MFPKRIYIVISLAGDSETLRKQGNLRMKKRKSLASSFKKASVHKKITSIWRSLES